VSLVEHIAAQRTDFGVPHTVACRALGVAASTFYERRSRPPSATQRRRGRLDAAVAEAFEASGGTYGSPRVRAQLRRDGLAVSKKSVEASMTRLGLNARPRRRRRGLTRPDAAAAPAPDLIQRDFTAEAPNQKWCGDFKQADTDQGPVYLASVEDPFSRRILAFATSERYPTAPLAKPAAGRPAADPARVPPARRTTVLAVRPLGGVPAAPPTSPARLPPHPPRDAVLPDRSAPAAPARAR